MPKIARVRDYAEAAEALEERLRNARNMLAAGRDMAGFRALEAAAEPMDGRVPELERNPELKPRVANLGAIAATAARHAGAGRRMKALKLLDEVLED